MAKTLLYPPPRHVQTLKVHHIRIRHRTSLSKIDEHTRPIIMRNKEKFLEGKTYGYGKDSKVES